MSWRRTPGVRLAAVLLLALALAWLAARVWLTVVTQPASPAARAALPTDPAVRALVARCRIAMANGVCRAMPASAAASASAVPAPQGPVVIAGFGVVDPAIVARLNRDGEAMCDGVATTCQGTPDDPLCRVARVLWP